MSVLLSAPTRQMWPTVSGTKTLAVDSSSAASCDVHLIWIGLIVPPHPTDVWTEIWAGARQG